MDRQANRRRLAVADRRAEIVAAAVRLLGRRTPEGLSLPEVAAEAGASRALVYHYFRDRKTLHSAA
ncbi:MAG: TetR family transcriptional regulator, partial [Actinophytocola sp.]|nr:TetR family transcriptional regulator [Actinophytocola sp.]